MRESIARHQDMRPCGGNNIVHIMLVDDDIESFLQTTTGATSTSCPSSASWPTTSATSSGSIWQSGSSGQVLPSVVNGSSGGSLWPGFLSSLCSSTATFTLEIESLQLCSNLNIGTGIHYDWHS